MQFIIKIWEIGYHDFCVSIIVILLDPIKYTKYKLPV